MQSGQFGLDDMLSQMQQLRKLGPLSGIMKMIPGMPKLQKMNDEDSEKKLKMTESIIFSMTKEERRDQVLLLYLEKRIAKGFSKDVAAVNRLLKQFEESKKMMKMLGNVDPNTGMPMPGGRAKNPNIGNPNRKKIRHKKKKK